MWYIGVRGIPIPTHRRLSFVYSIRKGASYEIHPPFRPASGETGQRILHAGGPEIHLAENPADYQIREAGRRPDCRRHLR